MKETTSLKGEAGVAVEDLTPAEIVAELDKYIIGQDEAKRAVAVAIRNRWRRLRVPPRLREEITPKNILMIGPTGVGKTEIARRMAQITRAPFLKVEATKFTEVGYVGRSVDSIIRELVGVAVRLVTREHAEKIEDKIRERVEKRILDRLFPLPEFRRRSRLDDRQDEPPALTADPRLDQLRRQREETLKKLRAGELDEEVISIEVSPPQPQLTEVMGEIGLEEFGIDLESLFSSFRGRQKKTVRLTVGEARELLMQEEVERQIDRELVVREAVSRAEQSGIVFIDELDKVVGKGSPAAGPDVSREGVQRDLLPLVEGTTVLTKYGPVRTNHILFIAAGAFHNAKPSDLIPELQGRFPIRVEPSSLGKEDYQRILVEPDNALTKQYQALLGADGVELEFTPDGIEAIAEAAQHFNETIENIGARRLHTLMEFVLQEVSFNAPQQAGKVVVDRDFVDRRLRELPPGASVEEYIL